ncbi:uncharacterized protein J8A68_001035 [[Candida] subhashii]|uniref:Uncharacterized protein n=1 Tax=[Candida] subhashii TaxID=561895 RepID=A0A8J5QV26_9ASCO|nr:uncharacterized protein J8A68_001035 [[Candida] subhashii]KAG7665347.1 hypothetical protein J8A68_001035 [[Candida] subhashii]
MNTDLPEAATQLAPSESKMSIFENYKIYIEELDRLLEAIENHSEESLRILNVLQSQQMEIGLSRISIQPLEELSQQMERRLSRISIQPLEELSQQMERRLSRISIQPLEELSQQMERRLSRISIQPLEELSQQMERRLSRISIQPLEELSQQMERRLSRLSIQSLEELSQQMGRRSCRLSIQSSVGSLIPTRSSKRLLSFSQSSNGTSSLMCRSLSSRDTNNKEYEPSPKSYNSYQTSMDVEEDVDSIFSYAKPVESNNTNDDPPEDDLWEDIGIASIEHVDEVLTIKYVNSGDLADPKLGRSNSLCVKYVKV